MPVRLRARLALGRHADNVPEVRVEIVDVGLTPIPLPEDLPVEHREFVAFVQQAQHDQINKIAEAVAHYDAPGLVQRGSGDEQQETG